MADVLTLAEVQSRTPSLSAEDQELVYLGINAAVRRVAPCLAGDDPPADALAEARVILVEVLARREDVASWVESITTGPYTTRFRAAAASVSLLGDDDEAALAKLCAATDAVGEKGPGPRGSFPPPPSAEGRFRW